LKGQEQSGPLGAGRLNAWAGRHRQAGSENNLEASQQKGGIFLLLSAATL
jgi:hypothetical protein